MEPWNGPDNRHTGPQGEAGFDSCWPIKNNSEKYKNTTEIYINGCSVIFIIYKYREGLVSVQLAGRVLGTMTVTPLQTHHPLWTTH